MSWFNDFVPDVNLIRDLISLNSNLHNYCVIQENSY